MGGGVGMDEAGETLAGFVAARMGEAVLERSVRPIIAGIYTADPSVLATDTVAPGLRAETARHGSLAAASRRAWPPPDHAARPKPVSRAACSSSSTRCGPPSKRPGGPS